LFRNLFGTVFDYINDKHVQPFFLIMTNAKQDRLIAFFLVCGIFVLQGCQIIDGPCIRGEGNVVTREISIEDFSKVNLAMAGEVTIERGEEIKVSLMGHPNILDQISIEVTDNEWVIYPRECVSNSKDFAVHITMPAVNGITLSSSGSIVSSDAFEGNIEMTLSGSGQIKFNASGEEAIIRLSGSGKIEYFGQSSTLNVAHSGSGRIILEGSCAELEIAQSGSGGVEAYGLVANEAAVRVSGSGSARVNVTTRLGAILTGSGSIFYKGSPIFDPEPADSGSGAIINDN